MSQFKISGGLTNPSTITGALYANQNDSFATDAQDTQILYYENGSATSSANLTFSDSKLAVDGNAEVLGGRLEVGFSSATSNRGVDLGATPGVSQTAYLDFNSTDGSTRDYDARLLSVGGDTGSDGKGSFNIFAGELNVNNPMRVTPSGAPPASKWFIDYGSVPIPAGTNTGATIVFNTVFETPPHVIISVQAPASATGDQYAFVENEGLAVNACNVQYFGNAPANTRVNWIAIGGVL